MSTTKYDLKDLDHVVVVHNGTNIETCIFSKEFYGNQAMVAANEYAVKRATGSIAATIRVAAVYRKITNDF